MSFELVITFIMLGAYLFFSIDTSLKMFFRCVKYDDYSRWQRHLYAIWSVFMFFIALQLVWDANVYYFPQLTWDSTAHLNVQDICILNIPICGLVLWTMTTHQIVDVKRSLKNLGPFAVLILIGCVVRKQAPWFVFITYAYTVGYCFYLLRIFLENAKDYNKRLEQTYADTQYRTLTWMRHLIWLMAITLVLYIYFAYVSMDQDYIYYGVICAIWYFISWNISHARETNALEDIRLEEEEELEKAAELEAIPEQSQAEKERAELARSSLRELTKQRLEDTLEETLMSRRLYLNPDLTVLDLAQELNTNRTYVSQYFSEHHTTFLKYINDLRVEYAMFQIKNTNHKLSDIMYDSGFRHGETFRRAFVNRYEVDPRDVPRKGSSINNNANTYHA